MKHTLLIATSLVILSSPYAWANESFEDMGESFENSEMVSDEELGNTRGGFSIGGLTIEFGLTTQTLINGQLQGQLELSSDNFQDLTINDLQQLVQTGAGNNANDALQALANNPNLLSVIQNSLNDTVIRQETALDIQVSGIQNFQAEVISPVLDLAIVDSLR